MRDYFFLLLILIFSSCANIVAPTGGEKDIEPPVPVVIIPENRSINFERNSIVLSFNEFIQISSPKDQIIISPALEQPAEFDIKKRTVVINFNAPLQPNTTYTINFGDAIKDLNEGNSLLNFTYVFSTGEYLDSASVAGKVTESSVGKPIADAIVALYKNAEDSIIFNEKPFYFTRSAKEGDFVINNVKQGQYKVISFKDLNNNLIYDPNELIGFKDDLVYVSDTTENIQINLFKGDGFGKINAVTNPGIGRVSLIALNKIDTTKINISQPVKTVDFSSGMDTITYWLSDPKIDSIKVFVEKEETIDTFKLQLKALGRDTVNFKEPFSFWSALNDSLINLGKPVIIEAPYPIAQFNSGSIILMEDSIEVNPTINIKNQVIELDYSWEETKMYSLLIPAGTVENIYNAPNKAFNLSAKAKSKEEYGTLTLKANFDGDQQYILQLFLGRNNDLVFEKTINESLNAVKIENLIPGSYSLRIIVDEIENERWDTGDYFRKKQPEKVINYPTVISIKPNWEAEVEVIIE